MTLLPRTDVHQHLWPPELRAALADRAEPPFARRESGAWRLHVPGEPAAIVPAPDDEALLRANPARLLG
jgi:hypothetical protein